MQKVLEYDFMWTYGQIKLFSLFYPGEVLGYRFLEFNVAWDVHNMRLNSKERMSVYWNVVISVEKSLINFKLLICCYSISDTNKYWRFKFYWFDTVFIMQWQILSILSLKLRLQYRVGTPVRAKVKVDWDCKSHD